MSYSFDIRRLFALDAFILKIPQMESLIEITGEINQFSGAWWMTNVPKKFKAYRNEQKIILKTRKCAQMGV